MQPAGLVGSSRVLFNSVFDADWRFARHWVQQGFKLERAPLEQRQLRRLAQLVQAFNAAGLHELSTSPATAPELAWLRGLPITDRYELRKSFERVKAMQGQRKLREDMTSGTTGIRVMTLLDCRLDKRNEAHKFMLQSLMGGHPGQTQVCLWAANEALGLAGPPRGRFSRHFYPRWQYNGFTPDERVYRALYEKVLSLRGCMLIGYAGALAECATVMLANGWRVPPGHVRCGWTSAEALLPARREAIERAFGFCPAEMYGCREAHWMAIECPRGSLHCSARHIIEVVDEQGAAMPEGETGRILVTDLFNEVMPIVRYAVGDLGAVVWRRCPCGRSGFVFSELTGRSVDLIRLPSGRSMHTVALTWVMRDARDIVQWQLLRRGEREFEVLYSGLPMSAELAETVHAKSSELLEDAEVRVTHVDFIPKTAAGKLTSYRDEWTGKLPPP